MAFTGLGLRVSNGNVTLTSGYTVAWDEVEWSKNGADSWWSGASPTLISPPAEVDYLSFSAFVSPNNSTNLSQIRLYRNGAPDKMGVQIAASQSTSARWPLVPHTDGDNYSLHYTNAANSTDFDGVFAAYDAATLPPFSGVLVKRAAAGGTGTISFDTEVHDAGEWWAVGNPTKIIIPTNVTLIEGWGFCSGDSNQGSLQRSLYFSKGGVRQQGDTMQGANSPGRFVTNLAPIVVAASDEITFVEELLGSTEANLCTAFIRKLD